jgi:hypothetical protein
MFRQLNQRVFLNPDNLFATHPIDLVKFIEAAWEDLRENFLGCAGSPIASPPEIPPLGRPDHRSDVRAIPRSIIGNEQRFPCTLAPWDHLIYAYMIENTRVYEIFRRVLFEFLHGEKLGTPIPESQDWLRTTEELFYRDPVPLTITSVASHIRPDLRANRRNAYQRMFGMDLNHGGEDGKPMSYVKAEAANSEFVSTFEEFLREVWIGMIYVNAINSSNPTDRSKIAELAEKLHDMLRSRRQNGNLSREEFAFVTAMSWFHLTLEYDSPIVRALRAEATGVEQRLFKIAERVGLPAHGLSKNFFDIADPMSQILIQIELGDYNDPDAVFALFTPVTGGGPSPEAALRTIITHWTAITGRDVKARKVAPS